MEDTKHIESPTKSEQKAAVVSASVLEAIIGLLKSEEVEIEIEETMEHVKFPVKALKLLNSILKIVSKGKTFSIVPMAAEVTTQKAAEMLSCSRPFLVKFLEEGEIPFTKVDYMILNVRLNYRLL